jgi:hypothetical protein
MDLSPAKASRGQPRGGCGPNNSTTRILMCKRNGGFFPTVVSTFLDPPRCFRATFPLERLAQQVPRSEMAVAEGGQGT